MFTGTQIRSLYVFSFSKTYIISGRDTDRELHIVNLDKVILYNIRPKKCHVANLTITVLYKVSNSWFIYDLRINLHFTNQFAFLI